MVTGHDTYMEVVQCSAGLQRALSERDLHLINTALSDSETYFTSDPEFRHQPDCAGLLQRASEMKQQIETENLEREQTLKKVDDALERVRTLNRASPQKKLKMANEMLSKAVDEAKQLSEVSPRVDGVVYKGESKLEEIQRLLEKMPGRDTNTTKALCEAIDEPGNIDGLRQALNDCKLYGLNEVDDHEHTVTMQQAQRTCVYRVACDIAGALLDLRQGAKSKRTAQLRIALAKCEELDYSTEEVEESRTSFRDAAAMRVLAVVRIASAKKVAEKVRAVMEDITQLLHAAREFSEDSNYTEIMTTGKRLADAIAVAKRKFKFLNSM